MACSNLLNGGIALGCEKNSGGISKVYITELSNVLGTTLQSPTGEISAFNMVSPSKFYEFEFRRNTSTFTEVTTNSIDNSTSSVIQTLTLKIPRRERAKRDVIALLSLKDLAIIVKDSNGLYWYLGQENGMFLTENNSESGTAKADFNGYTLTFTSDEEEQALEVLETAVNAVK